MMSTQEVEGCPDGTDAADCAAVPGKVFWGEKNEVPFSGPEPLHFFSFFTDSPPPYPESEDEGVEPAEVNFVSDIDCGEKEGEEEEEEENPHCACCICENQSLPWETDPNWKPARMVEALGSVSQLAPQVNPCEMTFELQGFPYCPNQWGQAGEEELPESIPTGKFGLLGTNLFAFGLPLSWDRQKLLDHFKVCGKVNRCRVIKEPKGNKKSRGFGFVSFVDHKSALRALQRLNGLVIGSGASRKRLRVTIKLGEEKYFLAAMRACDHSDKAKTDSLPDEAEAVVPEKATQKKRRRKSRKNRGQQEQEQDQQDDQGSGGLPKVKETESHTNNPHPSLERPPAPTHTRESTLRDGKRTGLKGSDGDATTRGPSVSFSPSQADSSPRLGSEVDRDRERGRCFTQLANDPFSLAASPPHAAERTSDSAGGAETLEVSHHHLNHQPLATHADWPAWTAQVPLPPARVLPPPPHPDFPSPPPLYEQHPMESPCLTFSSYPHTENRDFPAAPPDPTLPGVASPEQPPRYGPPSESCPLSNPPQQEKEEKGRTFSPFPSIPPPSRPAPTPSGWIHRSRLIHPAPRAALPPKVLEKALGVSAGDLLSMSMAGDHQY
uniref:RRM domain-containing protein n=1 Tax=Chromera velia CCMP2878 TaxID=1169474 RepID=A0A0G4HJU8_9ALVE|eukprot:Cvel_28375.t1-p1 / transcript=Cvel_28375.t1 / gene=Cvel_28375 / organism=Chromera_velia_CCMP2878 / gene_product=hypothetical protein / transcript_product=hypothetical protein / location=Cvel_scaffold3701:6168-8496(-) / protein_length=607 / sequence_SO=supercontig / SO=protein_coding / is_pseudo=false